jgi:hypothetical protein
MTLYTAVSFIPIVFIIFLLAVLNMPAKKVLPMSRVVCMVLAVGVFKMRRLLRLLFGIRRFQELEVHVTILGAKLCSIVQFPAR